MRQNRTFDKFLTPQMCDVSDLNPLAPLKLMAVTFSQTHSRYKVTLGAAAVHCSKYSNGLSPACYANYLYTFISHKAVNIPRNTKINETKTEQ